MNNIIDTIGNTPLVKLPQVSELLNCEIYAKIESANPGGSVKDRLAKALIEDAEKSGVLTSEKTIVEASSGNTGVGLAMIAAMKGYRVIVAMPDTMSVERRQILLAFGARLELTPGSLGMTGAINKAHELVEGNDNYIALNQFENPANAKAHYDTTGPEILDALPEFDYFVAGVGTGGTITGAGRYLKEMLPDLNVIAVEPSESPVLSGGKAAPHKIQGIGAGFVPKVLDRDVIDDVIAVSYEESQTWLRRVVSAEGVLCGISSGAAIAAVEKIADEFELHGKKIVVILPDTGERYLSSKIF